MLIRLSPRVRAKQNYLVRLDLTDNLIRYVLQEFRRDANGLRSEGNYLGSHPSSPELRAP